MLEYATKMAKHHHLATQADVQALRDVGFADADILHIIYWIGHFNMANTLSDAVGREVHENMSAVFVEEVPKEYGALGAGSLIPQEVLRSGWERATVRALEGLPLEWINSRPLSWKDVQGRLLLVTCWDAAHPNSLLAVPHLQRWHQQFEEDGLLVLACHAPEFPRAKDPGWARERVAHLGITFPVVHDPTFRRTQGSNNRYWPATHLIDRQGFVRFRHYGPGAFDAIERHLVALLEEREPVDYARHTPPSHTRARERWVHPEASPELYGTYYIGAPEGGVGATQGNAELVIPQHLEPHRLYGHGHWLVRDDGLELTGSRGRCAFLYRAERVYLFASTGRNGANCVVRLDGAPVPAAAAGPDLADSRVRLDGTDLYCLVDHGGLESHRLDLEVEGEGAVIHRFSFLPFHGVADD